MCMKKIFLFLFTFVILTTNVNANAVGVYVVGASNIKIQKPIAELYVMCKNGEVKKIGKRPMSVINGNMKSITIIQ
jgi:hypothetical protein